jgi:hypothetical protein
MTDLQIKETPSKEAMFSLMNSLVGCCLHKDSVPPEEIVSAVVAYADNSGDEFDSVYLFSMIDNRYGVFEEGSDYTGHG